MSLFQTGSNCAILTCSSSAVNSPAGNFTTNLKSAINLGKGHWKIALMSGTIWLSWYNISAAIGNNTLSYYNGTTNKTITIPDGIYTNIAAINSAIQDMIENNGDVGTNVTFEVYYNNTNTLLTLLGGYTVNLGVSKFYQILGFNATTYNASYIISPNPANVSLGNNGFLVTLDIVNANMSNTNGSPSSVIYAASWTVPGGTAQAIDVRYPRWLPLNVGNRQVISFNITVTNQDGVVYNFGQGTAASPNYGVNNSSFQFSIERVPGSFEPEIDTRA